MKQPTQSKLILSLKEIAFLGVYSALIIAFKEVMNPLPNIEPVSVMLIALTCVFGIKALFPAYVFSIIQILLHGFHVWNFMYLYVWAVLVAIALLIRPIHNVFGKLKPAVAAACQTSLWVVVAAIYGLAFGSLCSIPYFITGGFAYGMSFLVAGLYFDLLHCIGNAIITLVMFYPLYKILIKAKKMM